MFPSILITSTVDGTEDESAGDGIEPDGLAAEVAEPEPVGEETPDAPAANALGSHASVASNVNESSTGGRRMGGPHGSGAGYPWPRQIQAREALPKDLTAPNYG